ncbi:MAG: transposase [Verrucomicrobiaceae bacterium]|nr:MAG: transposase [Verrucomicrobiaceae bacterium]
MKQRGWYSRGYLPHLDVIGEIQAVTFRLADALPVALVSRWQRELAGSAGLQTGGSGEKERRSEDQRSQRLKVLIAQYEDAGHGSCLLREPNCAEIVQDALLHFDGERYRLMEWCIMPNHVHVIVKTMEGHTLDRILKSWKAFTSRKINESTGGTGPLWQREYHDRYIRDLDHLANARIYVRNNPVKAGFCEKPEDWPWGSAGHRS